MDGQKFFVASFPGEEEVNFSIDPFTSGYPPSATATLHGRSWRIGQFDAHDLYALPKYQVAKDDCPFRAIIKFGVHACVCVQDTWCGMVNSTPKLSTSCIFFPDGSAVHGKHHRECKCARLYGQEKNAQGQNIKHPAYDTWEVNPDGGRYAPWGCIWYNTWQCITDECVSADQRAVVIYKQGMCGDFDKGLGFSQKGKSLKSAYWYSVIILL